MSAAFLAAQKAALQAALKPIYADASLTKQGGQVSNGRGGFTKTPADPVGVLAKKESDRAQLTKLNIDPDKALIYVLEEGQEPEEGDMIELHDGSQYTVQNVGSDGLKVAYECVCDHA